MSKGPLTREEIHAKRAGERAPASTDMIKSPNRTLPGTATKSRRQTDEVGAVESLVLAMADLILADTGGRPTEMLAAKVLSRRAIVRQLLLQFESSEDPPSSDEGV